MQLSILQITILNMLSTALTGRAFECSKQEYISAMITECQEQGILYLVQDILMPLCTDGADQNRLLGLYSGHVRNEYKILAAQDDVLRLLKENGYHPVILKGWAAAQYYPVPENRTFGDIDILFPIEEFGPAVEQLLNSGYVYREEESSDFDSHIALKKNGICFEPHRFVAGLPEKEVAREYLDGLFSEGLKNPGIKNINGYDIPVFPELQNGLVLLLHIRDILREVWGCGSWRTGWPS